MRDLEEGLAGWIHAVQIMSWQQWVLRLTLLASGAAAAALCSVWFPVTVSTTLLVVALVLALGSAVWPDSVAPLFFIAVVALWWLAGGAGSSLPGGDGGSPWRWLGVSAAVAVFHLSSAFAAAAPSYARITGRAAVLLSRGLIGFVAVSVGVGAAVLGLAALPDAVLGLGWVAAGALAVAAVTVALVTALRARPTG